MEIKIQPGTMQKFTSSTHILLILVFYDQAFHFFLSVLSALPEKKTLDIITGVFLQFLSAFRGSQDHTGGLWQTSTTEFFTMLCGCLLRIFSFSCDPLVEKTF